MKHRLGVIDGLRGLAILLVVWYHLDVYGASWTAVPWLAFIPAAGLYGVDLFFFLSGFVIVYPFVRAQFDGRAEPAWTHFVWRRFIKIVPSYALSIAIAYAIGFAAYERLATHTTLFEELWTHALFIHTWWPNTSSSINGVLWTLAIEVQFYAVFPLIWWCFRRQPWMTGLALIALAWGLRASGGHLAAAAMPIADNLPGYVDLFACGMLCAWAYVHFGRDAQHIRFRYLMPLTAAAGAAIVLAIMVRHTEGAAGMRLAGVALIQPRLALGTGFALVAFGALCSPGRWPLLLANPPLQFMAIVSYNLYLYNWMILFTLRPLHAPFFAITGFLVSIAFAALVTYLAERPLLRLPDPAGARGELRGGSAA